MWEAFSSPHNRNRTWMALGTAAVLAVAAAVAGISDNIPGIALAYLAALAFVVAFAHPWQESKQFLRLMYASVVGLVVLMLLHNLFDTMAGNLGGFGSDLVGGASAVFFVAATMICPAGFLVGAIGAAVRFRHERHSHAGHPAV